MAALSPSGPRGKGGLNLPSISANFHPSPRSTTPSRNPNSPSSDVAGRPILEDSSSRILAIGGCPLSVPRPLSAPRPPAANLPTNHSSTAVNLEQPPQVSAVERSYADAALNRKVKRPHLPAHKFNALRPTKEGNQFSLKIPQEMYLKEVENFKFALIGRLLSHKGDKPRFTLELKTELQHMWNISNEWQLIPLGKGYFTLRFSNAEDNALAKGQLLWELAKGQLRIREWMKCFDPFKVNSPLANVWVRIHYLPIDFWNPEIISGIGRFLGHPLTIDGASAARDFGQYVRILIEIDMSQPLPKTLLIDGETVSFHVEFVFENLPLYCSRCRITGHTPTMCRKLQQNGQFALVGRKLTMDKGGVKQQLPVVNG
ncbi:uncharacterized protein LOC131018712 [Salvia miltiorrhiza]|uniref:uncharacterized protein LOC131018712 n=1 Tax=Salvia miltiorrhiza TaxID=226208 RepID=UPI0025AD330C|nr:uncharacterized protein LOC131018712 [Salvia miltiorrhiza]